MCQCTLLLKDKIIIRKVFVSYWHFVKMVEHLNNAIIDMQFMLDEKEL